MLDPQTKTMILFKLFISLILTAPAYGASSSVTLVTTSTISLMGDLTRASAQASTYASLLRSYDSASGYICLRCLDAYVSSIITNLYSMPGHLKPFSAQDMDSIMPEFNSMTQAIGYALDTLVEVSNTFGRAQYAGIVRAQIGQLGLAYSIGVSSLWASIESNFPCSGAQDISKRLDDFGSDVLSAASAYSADAVSYVPVSNDCFTRLDEPRVTVSVPTTAIYAGVESAASSASEIIADSTNAELDMATSTRSALNALATAIRSAKNAALAYPSMAGTQENLNRFRSATQLITQVFRLMFQANATSYQPYDYEYRALSVELAAMLYAQLEKANSMACSDYRSVASQLISITSAKYAVSTKIFSNDMAAFPTIRPPYTQTCLASLFASPTLAWATYSSPSSQTTTTGMRKGTLTTIVAGAIVGFIIVSLWMAYCFMAPFRRTVVTTFTFNRPIDANPWPTMPSDFLVRPIQPAVANPEVLLEGTCAQCGSDVTSDREYVTCCEQVFHTGCVGPDTNCLGRTSACIGRPVPPQYEKPPDYHVLAST